MKIIFEKGSFHNFRIESLLEAQGEIRSYSQYGQRKVTVFISHKHGELEDLKGIIGFLEKNYGIKAYIDSQDPSMPKTISYLTAQNLKKRITACDKFILLATDGAVESKWCNWELGYGDAHKFKKNIAIFPLKNAEAADYQYKGHEYLDLYPSIIKTQYGDKYSNGNTIPIGYYVKTRNDTSDTYYLTPLQDWLKG